MLSSPSLIRKIFEAAYYRGKARAVLLALIGLLGCTSSGPLRERIDLEEKSMAWGVFLATVPGFFVHGLGSLYAGDRQGVTDLLSQEVIALYFGGGMAVGLGAEWAWRRYGEDRVREDVVEEIQRVLYWQSRTTGVASLAVGGYYFLSSWIEDILRTPQLISLWNRKRRAGWANHRDSGPLSAKSSGS